MRKTIFQNLSDKQKRLARHAVLDCSLRRAEREPTKQELRDMAVEAFRNTAKQQEHRA